MERDEIIRKAVHMCAPLFALAYLIPEDLGPISRDILMVSLWGAFAVFEIVRIHYRIEIRGLREYEYGRPSASFQMCTAFLVMILFFPLEYALPLLAGFGFVDPLIGILRKRRSRSYPIVPFIIYAVMMTAILSLFWGPSLKTVAISLIVAAVAIISESIKNSVIDDDLLMLLVPLIALWILDTLF